MSVLRNYFGIILVGFLALSGISFLQAEERVAKRAVLIIPQKDVQDDEFLKTAQVLEANGIDVTVASTTLDEVTGTNGAKFKADILLADLKLEEVDAVVFIGGPGAAQYIDDPLAHKLAQDTVQSNKILAAICLAPRILAGAGVLKGKNATVYPTEGDKLRSCSVNYTAKPVEKDGNIITADGPNSAKQFGEAIVKALEGGRE